MGQDHNNDYPQSLVNQYRSENKRIAKWLDDGWLTERGLAYLTQIMSRRQIEVFLLWIHPEFQGPGAGLRIAKDMNIMEGSFRNCLRSIRDTFEYEMGLVFWGAGAQTLAHNWAAQNGIVRSEIVPDPYAAEVTPHILHTNVLVIFANSKESSQLRLENEDRVIRECIERSKHRDNITIEVRHAARIDDFARALLDKDYRVIQFSGHGAGEGLAFENEIGEVQVVPINALAELLSAYSPPIECAILNACYSNVYGLSVGVPYTIMMDGPISDEGATEFVRGFYDAIGAGKTVEFAYQEGRRRVKLKNLPDAERPILYIGKQPRSNRST